MATFGDEKSPPSNIATNVPEQGKVIDQHDVAAQFMAKLDSSIAHDPISHQEARKVLWKIDLTLIPMIMVTCILCAVDKVIIANAAIYGMKKDAHLVGNEYSWVGSIFYFGYLAAEYPVALALQRFPVAKLYAVCMFTLGVLLMCTAATHNFAGLASVRFLQGMVESIVFPVSSILTVMWWTTEEQPVRVALWFNQLSSVFAGIVSYGIGHSHSHLAPWRLLFLTFGAFTILWAAVLAIFLPDSPVKCWYMTDREKYIAVQRVRRNNTGIEDKKFKLSQVIECLVDPKTWCLVVFSFTQNVPNGGLVTFASIIVSGLGYSALLTTLLGIPTGVLATVWQLILGFLASKLKNKRCTIIAVANLVPMTCAILMWKLPRTDKHGLLAAYYVFYTYWAPYVLSTSLPMANVSGHTKKLTMNALFFLAYCVGNIVGPQLFQAKFAPTYSNSYEGLLACVAIAILAISTYGFLCRWENSKRDRAYGQDAEDRQEEALAMAFSDRTDKEKKEFRYTY
ncbi:hypothetical protein ANO11243_009820 [Dothideomycetidae sp. 11243]|nr:hypothetical protein ANO11243_009820 [fungal sp. No.11243]